MHTIAAIRSGSEQPVAERAVVDAVAPGSAGTGAPRALHGRAVLARVMRCGVCLVLGALSITTALAQGANDGFKPDPDGIVAALATQADGKVVVGGGFVNIAGQPRSHLARLLPDGSLDPDFAVTVVDSDVMAVAVQRDGKILIGGFFTQVGAFARNRIARLNADGSVDSAFNPNANSFIDKLAVQADGKILLGGGFTTLDGGVTARNYIARLNADGSVDGAFNPNANGIVRALAVQADGKILLGGDFTTLDAGVTVRNHIARLNADGSVDGAFNPNANGIVGALAVQADGKILLGGLFTTLDGGATVRNYIALLSANGTVDLVFNPNADASVVTLAVQADGKILLGGLFTTLDGDAITVRSHIARLNANGTLDVAFNPNANGTIVALAVQADGKTLLGGSFTTVGGAARANLARIEVDGSLDRTADPNVNGTVVALAVQADGKTLFGGSFTTLNGGGTARNNIARLNANGSVDGAFNPNADGTVFALAVQADGKILLGGLFTTLNGGTTVRNRIARLNADGSVDSVFNPNANSAVPALAVQTDGKMLLGGNFTTLGGGATARNHIARLNADGSVDSAFNPNANDTVYTLAVQADGKILLGGDFTTLDGGATVRNRIARLNANGSVDGSFNPNANDTVYTLAVQADGKILLGGYFRTLDGGATARNRIARLNANGSVDGTFNPNADGNVSALAVQADGKILLGGIFSTLDGGATVRNQIARLNADGSVDSAFNPNANGGVLALAVQADGKILLGGFFTTLDGGATARNSIARLSTTKAALQSVAIDGSTVTWLRSGAGPELALPPTLEFSVSGTTYAPAGTLSRIAGGWRGGITQPVGQTFYVRVRGAVSSGRGNGSQGLIENVHQFFGNDRIFADGVE